MNNEEILACFVVRFEVAHVSVDISKKIGQKSYSDWHSNPQAFLGCTWGPFLGFVAIKTRNHGDLNDIFKQIAY